MCFRNYGLEKQHGKPAETLFESQPTTAPLPYLLINFKVTELENVYLRDIQKLKTVC